MVSFGYWPIDGARKREDDRSAWAKARGKPVKREETIVKPRG